MNSKLRKIPLEERVFTSDVEELLCLSRVSSDREFENRRGRNILRDFIGMEVINGDHQYVFVFNPRPRLRIRLDTWS
jgi:hypothetical protein